MAKPVAITGVKAIDRRLRRLEPKVQRKYVRAAMRRAMKPVKAQVEIEAPRETGFLSQQVKIRARKGRRGTLGINVQIGENDFQGDTYYAAFQELGTQYMDAKDFMGRSYAMRADEARRIALDDLRDAVLREAKAK